MKSETAYKRDLKWTFIYPVFTSESKKEDKAARRMNVFFTRMGEQIEKYAASDGFPDGGKFAAECTHDHEGDVTVCRFTLRHRGRLRYSKKVAYTWHNGYIKNSNIM